MRNNERAFRNQNSAARRQLPGLRHSARRLGRGYLEVARHSSKPAQPNCCTRCGAHLEEGRLVEMTVVFADLSGFTEMTAASGQRPSTQSSMSSCAWLDHTYQPRSVHRQIYRRCGDGLIQRSDKTRRPCGGCGRGFGKLKSFFPSFRTFGQPLHASVGIASGFAHVGRLGSDESRIIRLSAKRLTRRRACRRKPCPMKYWFHRMSIKR